MLAGGLGAGALIALPDLSGSGRLGGGAAPASSASPASEFVLVYGVQESAGGGSIQTAMSVTAKTKTLPKPRAIAGQLAAMPVASPDQASVALVTVDTVSGGANINLTLVNAASAVVLKKGSLAIADIADGSSILAKPVFAAGTTTVALVLAVTEPTDSRLAVKKNARTGINEPFQAVTWVTQHMLAYFDTATGSFTGPFRLGNAPALALTTAAANSTDLFVWNTAEPQAGTTKGSAAPLPWVSVFPLGTGEARLKVPSPAPWPGGEPVVTLASGDVARLVRGGAVQVASAQTGDVNETKIAALGKPLAKAGAVTMTAQPDGNVFIAKPAAGRALIADPADSFSVKNMVEFPPPKYSGGGPADKALLSSSGEVLYVLGGGSTGGVSAYSVATGKLVSSYSRGTNYLALYLRPGGNLLAVSASNPRVEFLSPDLEQLGTAATTLQIAAVF